MKKVPFSKATLGEYSNLIKWTAAEQSYIRRGIPRTAGRCLNNHYTKMAHWFAHHLPKIRTWQRAIGFGEALDEYTKSFNQRWIQRCTLMG